MRKPISIGSAVGAQLALNRLADQSAIIGLLGQIAKRDGGAISKQSTALFIVFRPSIILDHPFQGHAILRIGRVNPGQRIGKRLGVVFFLHRRLIGIGGCQQLAVQIEGL